MVKHSKRPSEPVATDADQSATLTSASAKLLRAIDAAATKLEASLTGESQYVDHADAKLAGELGARVTTMRSEARKADAELRRASDLQVAQVIDWARKLSSGDRQQFIRDLMNLDKSGRSVL